MSPLGLLQGFHKQHNLFHKHSRTLVCMQASQYSQYLLSQKSVARTAVRLPKLLKQRATKEVIYSPFWLKNTNISCVEFIHKVKRQKSFLQKQWWWQLRQKNTSSPSSVLRQLQPTACLLQLSDLHHKQLMNIHCVHWTLCNSIGTTQRFSVTKAEAGDLSTFRNFLCMIFYFVRDFWPFGLLYRCQHFKCYNLLGLLCQYNGFNR